MTYPPTQSFTVQDGQLGITDTQTALPLIIGVSSSGTAATLYQYQSAQALRNEQGYGPGVECAAPIADAGGCLFLKTAATTVGTNSSVTKTAIGTSTGTVTLSGAPRDHYLAILRIRGTGTVATGQFDYSLDNGYTFSETYTIPAGGTFLIPGTATTVTFVAGGGPTFFENGDKHVWTGTAPHYTTGDISTAITALLAQIGTRKIRRVFFAGKNSSASNGATMAAAIATHMATLATRFYFARALMDAGEDTVANYQASFGSFSDRRVGVCFGNVDVVSMNQFAGWGVPNLPWMNTVAERAAIAQLSENLGRRASGSLRGVRAVSHDARTTATPFAELDKVITATSLQGEAGFFVTNGVLKAPAGSDFKYWDWGCTIDELCEIIYNAQKRWELAKLRTVKDGTGHILPQDAARVNSGVRAQIKTVLLDPPNIEGYRGHVSAASYAVDETNNFLSTQELISAGSAIPLAPAEKQTTTVGFARSAA